MVEWLLAGDVAVQYQVHRDLLGGDRPDLQARIATEGAGAALLAARTPSGHWGRGFYQPKWTSSHYTLLQLKNMAIARDTPAARETVALILEGEAPRDGGVSPKPTAAASDVCVNGMVLNYASYFGAPADRLRRLVDVLLSRVMADGGFNCRSPRGATHGSLHTTVSVLEGITEYGHSGYSYRLGELNAAAQGAMEFMLRHRLYLSERTGDVINPEFIRFHVPARWHYDVLRGLDALLDGGLSYEPRLDDALALVQDARRADGRWVVSRHYTGETHHVEERAGVPSRWATLVAERVLEGFQAGNEHLRP